MENNNTCVYQHVRLDTNQIFYIGIGCKKRPNEKINRNKWWHNIVNKTEYRVDILFNNLTWVEACTKEIELIKLYGRKDLGNGILVNMTDGGDGCNGLITSDETRKKISIALMGRIGAHKGKPRSEETKLKISETLKGKTGRKYSEATKEKMCKPKSEETKLKMSEAKKGRIFNEEHKLKLSISAKNRKPVSEETKLKISLCQKGKKRGPHTEETKLNMSLARKGKKRGPMSEEQKNKISETLKNRNKLS